MKLWRYPTYPQETNTPSGGGGGGGGSGGGGGGSGGGGGGGGGMGSGRKNVILLNGSNSIFEFFNLL